MPSPIAYLRNCALIVLVVAFGQAATPVCAATEPYDGPYHQFDVFKWDATSDISHSTRAFSDATHTQDWNQELGGVPFKWQNDTAELGGGTKSLSQKDTLIYILDKPRRATHIDLLVNVGWGMESLRGQTMGQVDVEYDEGGKSTLDLVLGTNLRNNRFFLPTDPEAKDHNYHFFDFVSDTSDTKHVCQVFSGKVSGLSVRYAVDRVKLPLPDDVVKARKHVKKITLRNIPHFVQGADFSNTPAPVQTKPVYSYLVVSGLTLGKEYPILVVPGFMGTVLQDDVNDATPWPNSLFGLTPDAIASMGFTPTGQAVNPSAYPCRLLGVGALEVSSLNAYGDLVKYLQDKMGYKLATGEPTGSNNGCWNGISSSSLDNGCVREDLYTMPYDWRMKQDQMADILKNTVANIKARTGADKVDIICHSNGGIVSRTYLARGGAKDVDTFISMGTPYLGVPKVLRMLRYGEPLIDQAYIRDVHKVGFKRAAQHMPGVYGMYPSRKYLAESKYFTYNLLDVKNAVGHTLAGNMDYDTLTQWMSIVPCKTDFTSPVGPDYCSSPDAPLYDANLLQWSQTLHDEIDNWDASGPDAPYMYAIMGSGLATAGIMVETPVGFNADGTPKREATISWTDGDKTVNIYSAEGYPDSVRKHYFIKGEHVSLPNLPEVDKQLQLLIPGIDQVAPGMAESATPPSSGEVIHVFSPVSVDVADSAGNHTGAVADGTIKEDIPYSSYYSDGDDRSKTALITGNDSYTLTLHGTDTGTAALVIEDIRQGQTARVLQYLDLPVTPQTKMTLVIPPDSSVPQLKIDADGDGTPETTRDPTVLTPDQWNLLPPGVDAVTPPNDGAAQKPGDVNNDGLVNVQDAIQILQAATKLLTLSPDAAAAADVTGDGAVNIQDAIRLLRVTVGLDHF